MKELVGICRQLADGKWAGPWDHIRLRFRLTNYDIPGSRKGEIACQGEPPRGARSITLLPVRTVRPWELTRIQAGRYAILVKEGFPS